MTAGGPLTRTPFFFLGRRPYREAELAAYIRREHRRGRRLSEILEDRYVTRCGGPSVLRSVLRRDDLIRALKQDIIDAIARNTSAAEEVWLTWSRPSISDPATDR